MPHLLQPPTHPADPEGDSLYRRLVWLTLLRIALVTLLLGASAAVVLQRGSQDLGVVEQVLYGTILATYVASLIYLLLLRGSPQHHRRLAYAEVTGDAVIASCLVYLTGGAESILVFMFPLTVVSAAVLLYRRGAVASAILSSAGLLSVVVGLNSGWLPAPSLALAQTPMPNGRLAFFAFAHVSAIFLTATLASYLAEQLRATRARLTLRESDYFALEALHESIVRSIASGIVATDRFGRITFVNRAAELISGRPSSSIIGQPAEQLFPSLAGRLHQEVLPTTRYEEEHRTASGERRCIGFALAPLLDPRAKNHGFVVTFQDLTSIRAMEEVVRRSERLAALGAMAAGLAHELRNPLASMTGSIQLLGESKAFSDDEQRLMSIVLREADRLNALVTEVLQFARPAPAQLEPFELQELIEATATLFRNDPTRRCVELLVKTEPRLPVQGDRRQLGQVLWNLLANAAEAMVDGGQVRVEAEQRDGRVELRVSDAGPGIAPGDLPRIFDPFYTTKERGTGLGLAVVHSIVSSHGGQISVQSEPGRGTTFSVMLPARAVEVRSEERS